MTILNADSISSDVKSILKRDEALTIIKPVDADGGAGDGKESNMQRQRKVVFDEIVFHVFKPEIGDSPSCSGCPIALCYTSHEQITSTTMKLYIYEKYRAPRRKAKELVLDKLYREEM